jgi:hypothetical protein
MSGKPFQMQIVRALKMSCIGIVIWVLLKAVLPQNLSHIGGPSLMSPPESRQIFHFDGTILAVPSEDISASYLTLPSSRKANGFATVWSIPQLTLPSEEARSTCTLYTCRLVDIRVSPDQADPESLWNTYKRRAEGLESVFLGGILYQRMMTPPEQLQLLFKADVGGYQFFGRCYSSDVSVPIRSAAANSICNVQVRLGTEISASLTFHSSLLGAGAGILERIASKILSYKI